MISRYLSDRRSFPAAVLLVSLILASSDPAVAAEYWVDGVAGNDSNTGLSRVAAWRTVSRPNTVVRPGDVVHVLEGVYDQQSISPGVTGAGPDSRIVYLAEGRVTLERSVSTISSFVTMEGFEFRLSFSNGLRLFGSGAALRRCRFLRNARYGVGYFAISGALFEECEFGNNAVGGVVAEAGSMFGTTFRHCTFYNNAVFGALHAGGGSGNKIENCIFSSNATALSVFPPTNISDFNVFFGNSFSDGTGIAVGANDLFADPQMIAPANDIFHLRPTSPILTSANDGGAIGARGVGYVSSNASDSWAGWTDDVGAAVGAAGAKIVTDTQGNLRLRADLTSAAVLSPVVDVNVPAGTISSVDFEATVFTTVAAPGARQVVDFDPATRESEIRYRTASTAAGISTAPFQVSVRGRPIQATGRFVQLEYTLRRDGQ